MIMKLLEKRHEMKTTGKPRLHQDWIDHHAFGIVRALQNKGFTTYLVGGCVRDLLLGIEPKDFDIGTNARPEQVRKVIHKAFIIGRRFQLVLVKRDDLQFEVSTFRRQVEPTEGDEDTGPLLRDNSFGTPEEDARRRDFTVNSLFYDPVHNELIDFAGGQSDLEHRLIRMIGDPIVRLREDPIRILRAIRLKLKVSFQMDESLREAIEKTREDLIMSALPRRREEILKWMKLPDPSLAFLEAYDLGVLKTLIPPLHELLSNSESGDEFLKLLRQFPHSGVNLQSAPDIFGYLVWSFVRAGISANPLYWNSARQALDHPVLTPLMRDQLGMFKFEQHLVSKALHLLSLLNKRRQFESRGERRKLTLLQNEAFPMALQMAMRDYALQPEDLIFWFDQHLRYNTQQNRR